MKRLIPLCILLVIIALSGCTNPDAPSSGRSTSTSSTPQSPGEPPAPAPPSAPRQSPADVQPTPEKALTAFASLYVNWTYRTLSTNQRTLAGMSVGAARLSERQAATSSQADTTISRGHIFNRGQVVSIARDLSRASTWVIVTREQTGGDSEYAGLKAAYHVTLAQLQSVPGGWTVSQWLPQD
jgi:hypothetical protein